MNIRSWIVASMFAALCSVASCSNATPFVESAEPVLCGEGGDNGAGGSVSTPDAGAGDWCASASNHTLTCESCATAPFGEPWCGPSSPCESIHMYAFGCGYDAAIDPSCVEVGAHICNERGRVVCCPQFDEPAPQCENGAQECPPIGDCSAAYCAANGCAYEPMGQGNACGDGTMSCSNGICL